MDTFYTFLFLFLILFCIKIYLIRQKIKENFKNKKNKKPNRKQLAKMEKWKKLHASDSDSEQMGNSPTQLGKTPDIFDELDKIATQMEDLPKVYRKNTTGYIKGADKIRSYIPEIRTISGGRGDPFGILKTIFKPINSIIKFLNNIVKLINKTIFYTECSFMLLVNFFTVPCFFWYVLNLICVVVYLPFSFIFWLIGITDIVENYLWAPIYIVDEVFYNFTGFHFAHFPDNVIKGCYHCPAKFQVLGISGFTWIGDAFKVIVDVFNLFPKFK